MLQSVIKVLVFFIHEKCKYIHFRDQRSSCIFLDHVHMSSSIKSMFIASMHVIGLTWKLFLPKQSNEVQIT